MKVELLQIGGGLEAIDHAIGLCYDKGDYCDETKRDNRISKVALKNQHSSVLEFATFIFDIEASTKVLLEMTRHRHASYACKSSRYTLNKGEVIFESTGDDIVDTILGEYKKEIEYQIAMGKSNEIISLMLPQAYQYKWTAMFNARSLRNFLALRTSSSAHFQIRELANAMFECIPSDIKYLFEDCVK
ncbi:MAG: FAD-dependent thymidylate synthase [Candidatus Izemoplasmatales bacterium]|nr:FAD-dependent thymidylate synthase [Candidatus Izemoplasmatales bacterium]